MSRDISAAYKLFDLVVSSDHLIPGLSPTENGLAAPDVMIHMGLAPEENQSYAADPWYESTTLAEHRNPALRIWKSDDRDLFRLEYFDGHRFWIDGEGRHIWAVWPAASSIQIAASYLLGPVFGVLLRIRGITCLHGSAVSIHGRGVVLIGPAGAGKSTTAAALGSRGHSVLSDDIAAIHESGAGFSLCPAYPHLCLWPDSVAMLFQSPDAFPRIAEDSDKRRLFLDGTAVSFQEQPVPLSLVCVLAARSPGPDRFISEMSLQSALISLIANTYAGNLPLPNLRARELNFWGRFLSLVPVCEVHPASDARRLPNLCHVIEQNFGTKCNS